MANGKRVAIRLCRRSLPAQPRMNTPEAFAGTGRLDDPARESSSQLRHPLELRGSEAGRTSMPCTLVP
eukprot:6187289-Pleurochrysis_carterae.AAC.1